MTTPIQPINALGGAPKPEQGKEKSQAERDFDEGRGYIERGEAALAAVSLHNALKGFEEEGNRPGIANACNQLGNACLLRRDFAGALAHYRRAWDICVEHDDKTSLLVLSRQCIEAYRGCRDHRAALDTCLDLLDRYQRNNNPQGSVEVLELMAVIYVEANEPGKAADAYRTAASIHDNFKHHSIAENLRSKADELAGEAE